MTFNQLFSHALAIMAIFVSTSLAEEISNLKIRAFRSYHIEEIVRTTKRSHLSSTLFDIHLLLQVVQRSLTLLGSFFIVRLQEVRDHILKENWHWRKMRSADSSWSPQKQQLKDRAMCLRNSTEEVSNLSLSDSQDVNLAFNGAEIFQI